MTAHVARSFPPARTGRAARAGRLSLAGAFALLLGACVTINVYFPAAAAEQAADRIIDQVYGQGGAQGSAPPAPAPTDKRTDLAPHRELPRAATASRPDAPYARADALLLAAATGLLDLLVPRAEAQTPDLNVSTPAIRALVSGMEARHASLAPYLSSGAIGLTDDGLVELRDQNAVPLPERTSVRKLIADENADRLALYQEIAKANGNASWAGEIRKTFARRWIDKAQAGWYVRDAGGWKQK